MNSLSQRQMEYLLRSLSQGEMTEPQALQFAARNKVLTGEDYNRTLVLTGLGAAIAYVLIGASGGILAGAVVLAIGLEYYCTQRRQTQEKLKQIDQGEVRNHFLDEPQTLTLIDEWLKTDAVTDAAVETVVAASTVPPPPVMAVSPAAPAAAPIAPEPPRTIHPINYLLGDRPRTSLIISVSGGGKDILLSCAVREFLRRNPGYHAVVMDCKDDSQEYGYYHGLERVSVHRLNVAISSDTEIVKWVDVCLDEFLNLPQKALLLCNEGTLIRAKSKRYVDAIAGLVSSGDSREKYAWEAGQSAHTDDLNINGAARSRFRPLIIGLRGEEMQIEALLSAKFVADSARNITECKTQMSRSPVKRAWSDGQHWYPMPLLQNFSGYDRDRRSYLPGFSPTVATAQQPEAQPLPQVATLEPEDSKPNIEEPTLPRAELLLIAAELAEWIEQNSTVEKKDWYANWNAKRRGFSRPQFRFLLTLTGHE
jgi:hypothetical protein